MATRVLILHQKLVFAVTLKQALEQTGAFEVHPFTTIQATLEYLREHPQDVALVDFTLPDITSAQLVHWLRSTQPDLAIIASPRPTDAEAIMAALKIQGMVNAPFTARDIIPLLERAIDAVQQDLSLPTTRPLNDSPAQPPQEKTHRKDDAASQPPPAEPQFGQTRRLGEDVEPNLPATKPVPPTPVGKTRTLDDFEPELPDKTHSPEYGATRRLEDTPPGTPGQRNIFHIRQVDEPPIEEGDTPAVPTRDSDAARQFLVTSGTPGFDSLFDDVLDVIDAEIGPEDDGEEAEDKPEATRDDPFKGIIKSLSREETGTRLPERQKQGVDFTYTSGMDNVLREIARTKTGTLEDSKLPAAVTPDKPEPDTFEKLAQEEPPMPTLEDSGTIGDLMVGISDHQFRNVLALLRGEEPSMSSDEAERATIEEAFAGVFWPNKQDEDQPPLPPTLPEELPAMEVTQESTAGFRQAFDRMEYVDSFDDEAGDATIPQLILETALDDTTPLENFSLNRLIDDIDARLSIHKLAIRGLPSWGQDTGAFRSVDTEGIREPDFLPTDLPPGEIITPELLRMDESFEEDDGAFTTQPSEATRHALEEQAELSSVTLEWMDEEHTAETLLSRAAPEAEPQAPEDELLDRIEAEDEPAWHDETPVPEPTAFMEVEPESVVFEDEPIQEHAAPELPEWMDDSEYMAGEADTVFDGYGRFDDVPDYDDGYTMPEEVPDETGMETEEETWAAAPQPTNYDENTWLKPLLEIPEAEAEPEEQEYLQQQDEEPEYIPDSPETFASATPEPEMARPEDIFDAWGKPDIEDSETITRPLEMPADRPESEIHAAWDVAAHEESGSSTQPIEATARWDDERETGTMDAPDATPDSNVAQLAVSLTQASLELSAEATLLTHEGEIIAYAGHLSPEDIEELRTAIENDWDAQPEGARIRFVTLPSSGKDFMLYSILTKSDLTLSMIFGGSTPLRVIRKQGQILANALRSVPDVPAPPPAAMLPPAPLKPVPVPQVPALAETVLRVPYSYVWLLRDPTESLTDAAAQAIISGLTLQLHEQGWHIVTLQVHEDFVYLLAEVPGETPPNLVMTELKQRSADIARAQMPDIDTQTLWADSYLILTPGRELAAEEILEFVNFQRML
ncbi:MAG: transposase [Anaerolineaceae bacterium]|nr:transposase [Anaerolineaceae bacterium]